MSQEKDTAPEAELDFGIARLYLSGDEDTTFEELMEEFMEQKESMLEEVEDLKRLEHDIHEEYHAEETDGGQVAHRPSGKMIQ